MEKRINSVACAPRKWKSAALMVLAAWLSMGSVQVKADIFYRSHELVDGKPSWSVLKKYAKVPDQSGQEKSANAEEVRVVLSGEIVSGDLASAQAMMAMVGSGKQRIENNAVWLSSGGGDIDAGMELGRLLRQGEINAVVGKGDRCMSACVFVFMGGVRRSVSGELGIHRPYFPITSDAPDRQAKFKSMQRVLKNFVEEMDFPESLYEAVMSVPPESLQVVSAPDLIRLGLEGISPGSEDRVDAASAKSQGLSMFDYLQRKARSPACRFLEASQNGCDGKVLAAASALQVLQR